MRWLVAALLVFGLVVWAAGIVLPRPAERSGLVLDPLRVSTGLL